MLSQLYQCQQPRHHKWHNSIGTGPYILTDFVDSTAATLTKNTGYWAYDERYPANRLPYVNSVIYLIFQPKHRSGGFTDR